MAAEEISKPPSRLAVQLLSAFLAMESTDYLISLARDCGGGSITEEVQNFIMNHFFKNHVNECTLLCKSYIEKFLKKLIITIESSGQEVLEGLYEQHACCLAPLKDDNVSSEIRRICKSISFLFPDHSQKTILSPAIFFEIQDHLLVIPLRCSLNMLEGDTGCSIWPSSLFLSEFILSYPEMFQEKSCFEVGSGVGLVGIALAHVNASKVILSDGDQSSLENLKFNLELNHQKAENNPQNSSSRENLVECVYLPWESASEIEFQNYSPDIVLGADVVYDPACLPHLVQVLSTLLKTRKSNLYQGQNSSSNGSVRMNDMILKMDHPKTCKTDAYCHLLEETKVAASDKIEQRNASFSTSSSTNSVDGLSPVAYIATVIRNIDTFNCFLSLADEANLSVVDITETNKPLNLLPYMRSYDRSSIRLYKLQNCPTK
ncbi:hypothetical protein H6P81_001953 [Aristolochia fimbriata]|uniref:FAM86 N-terminal domain-containing protein n=1 Tax=Aristolochia fimbriata TaxID=158543 RepID=A0AAV7F8D7_ARIFI|nr:hypothetical protein H6P81_001953 [Aristolochia fimbriata]